MALSRQLATLLPTEIPVAPGADEARRWAQEELAGQVYQDAKPGWPEQIFALLRKALGELLNKIGVAEPNIGLAVLVGLLLLAILVVVLVVRPRLNRRKTGPASVFAENAVLTSDQHRALARTAALSGDFGTAVSEAFRAMVRTAEERDVSLPALGRTATEITEELARAFPSHSRKLTRSADMFNAVRYGKLPPTAAMYEEMLAIDAALAATTPHYVDDFAAVHP